jgi:hypothetical protein
MDSTVMLEQAIVAAKAGRKAEARHLLETLLDADDRNERAWLWMSSVVDSDEERIICLENVLTINPQHEVARRGLVAMGVNLGADRASVPLVSDAANVVSPAHPSTSGGDVPPAETSSVERRTFILITIVLALMLICTVIGIITFVILGPAG